jgi:hypothetical protein
MLPIWFQVPSPGGEFRATVSFLVFESPTLEHDPAQEEDVA